MPIRATWKGQPKIQRSYICDEASHIVDSNRTRVLFDSVDDAVPTVLFSAVLEPVTNSNRKDPQSIAKAPSPIVFRSQMRSRTTRRSFCRTVFPLMGREQYRPREDCQARCLGNYVSVTKSEFIRTYAASRICDFAVLKTWPFSLADLANARFDRPKGARSRAEAFKRYSITTEIRGAIAGSSIFAKTSTSELNILTQPWEMELPIASSRSVP